MLMPCAGIQGEAKGGTDTQKAGSCHQGRGARANHRPALLTPEAPCTAPRVARPPSQRNTRRPDRACAASGRAVGRVPGRPLGRKSRGVCRPPAARGRCPPGRPGQDEMRSSTPMLSFSFSYDTNAMAMDGTTLT